MGKKNMKESRQECYSCCVCYITGVSDIRFYVCVPLRRVRAHAIIPMYVSVCAFLFVQKFVSSRECVWANKHEGTSRGCSPHAVRSFQMPMLLLMLMPGRR